MFSFIKRKLQKIYSQFTSKIGALFGRTTVDAHTLQELEELLISSDTGVSTTRAIISNLKLQAQQGDIRHGTELQGALNSILLDILAKPPNPTPSNIFLLVGINGSGKTTLAGKLSHQFIEQGQKVLLVAADTFRAAAPEQLTRWAEKNGCDIVQGRPNQDPASVVFAGCQKFIDGQYDTLIIDTAGRLHNKVNLMGELAKIRRVITKKLPDNTINTLLIIDSLLGQNSFEQARLFKECTQLDSIVLTKMDGTGKGGIVFAIAQELDIPVSYITFGEQPDQIKPFNPSDYVHELLGM